MLQFLSPATRTCRHCQRPFFLAPTRRVRCVDVLRRANCSLSWRPGSTVTSRREDERGREYSSQAGLAQAAEDPNSGSRPSPSGTGPTEGQESQTIDQENQIQRDDTQLDGDAGSITFGDADGNSKSEVAENEYFDIESLPEHTRGHYREDDGPDLEADEDAEDASSPFVRSHTLTVANKFAPFPSTVFLPRRTFVDPITSVLRPTAIKHVRQTAETVFSGPGLPHSPLTPAVAHQMAQKPVPLSPSLTSSMSGIEANTVLSVSWAPMYAATRSCVVQVRKRLGRAWIRRLLTKRGGPRVLDVGSGGAAVLAWNEIVEAEREIWEEEIAETGKEKIRAGEEKAEGLPRLHPGGAVIVAPSHHLREKVTEIMAAAAAESRSFRRPESRGGKEGLSSTSSFVAPTTSFLPSIPQLERDPPSGRSKYEYDVILVPYALWVMEHDQSRRSAIKRLWQMLNPDGGVMIVIEKGTPRGFEVVAEARRVLLEQIGKGSGKDALKMGKEKGEAGSRVLAQTGTSTADERQEPPPTPSPEVGTIIAPCPSPLPCPMYPHPGVARNRKDFCYFPQRFIRPPFLQRVLGASKRNHADVEFSFVAFMRGQDLHVRTGDDFNRGLKLRERASETATQANAANTSVDGQVPEFWAGEEATARALAGYEFVGADGLGGDSSANTTADEDVLASSRPAGATMSLPRAILPPLKRRGHILLDVCTPSGTIERWTITKSQSRDRKPSARSRNRAVPDLLELEEGAVSTAEGDTRTETDSPSSAHQQHRSRQVYRDGRKIQWGDLWPLGAKSRAERNMRLGTVVKHIDQRDREKGEKRRRKEIKRLRRENHDLD